MYNAVLHFASYGISISVRSSSADLLTRLQPHLPPGWRPADQGTPHRAYTLVARPADNGQAEPITYVLEADGEEVARSERVVDVGKAFETDSRLFIAEKTTQRVFIHAGVVGWREKAIVIPGRTYTGKTTLVAALVKAGAEYFSDEYAVIDQRGLVHPYPKPLSIRDPHTGEQVDHPVEALNGQAATRPRPVGLVLVSAYQPGAVWAPDRLTPGEGMLALVDNSISIRTSPKLVLQVLTKVVGDADIVKGVRDEADDVVEYLKLHYPQNGVL